MASERAHTVDVERNTLVTFGEIVFGVMLGLGIWLARFDIGVHFIALFLFLLAYAIYFWHLGHEQAQILLRLDPRPPGLTDYFAVVFMALVMFQMFSAAANEDVLAFVVWFALWGLSDVVSEVLQYLAVGKIAPRVADPISAGLLRRYYQAWRSHLQTALYSGISIALAVAVAAGVISNSILVVGIVLLVVAVNEMFTTIWRFQTLKPLGQRLAGVRLRAQKVPLPMGLAPIVVERY